MAARLASVLAVAVAAAALLPGCLQAVGEYEAFDPDQHYRNPGVFPGNYTFGDGSTVLRPGPLRAGAPEVVHLRSTLPAYPGAAGEATEDGAVFITMAVWRPENATGPVPVLVEAGPYFEIGQHCAVEGQDPCRAGLVDDAIDHPNQQTPFALRNILPHGYAVVQLAVRGTGTHGGCMDLMGPAERHDLDQAITWLGTQPWSNGNVAMWGVSYDGSTPWIVAGTGNPHLRTILPISGLPDMHGLMFHNGSAETRGAIMHHEVYWPFGFSDGFLVPPPLPLPEPVPPPPEAPRPVPGQANGRQPYQDLQNLLCPEAAEGAGLGLGAVATGSRLGAASDYWTARDHRDDVLANYTGSVFLVHGLQDWNVDPHAAIPFNAALRAKGLEVKEWYGQWGHTVPDGCAPAAPEWVSLPCRLDWADVLLRWLDRHLKGANVDTGPAVQVQDSLGAWRNADAFPPASPRWAELHLTPELALAPQPSAGQGRATLSPANGAVPRGLLQFASEPLREDLRVSGLPQLRVPFEARGPGGELAAWLFDQDPDGNVRAPAVSFTPEQGWLPAGTPVIGHAQMDLRHHAGGDEPQPLVPGQRYVARMEMEPMEAVVPRGHRLLLWLFQGSYPDHLSTLAPSPVDVLLGDGAVLRLPAADAGPATLFPVPGAHFPQRGLLSRMHVPLPLGLPEAQVLPYDAPAAPGPPPLPPPPTPAPAPCALACRRP